MQWQQRCRDELKIWCIEALAPKELARHHLLLIALLEEISRGQRDRVMINMPPNHAKSTFASILFPAWFFIQHPQSYIIGASHGADLAEYFSSRIINLIQHHSKTLGYGLANENVKSWMTTTGGEYRAAGVGGSITGRRSDCFIIDDPVKGRAEAESETIRETIWNWYQAEVYTRLNPGARVVLIQTRWHADDLAGRLLNQQQSGGDQWHVIDLPALANRRDDPLMRAIDEPLWPERFGAAELGRIRGVIGEYEWAALYQGDPQPRGTAFFDVADCLVDMQPVEAPTLCDGVFATIDTAIKTGAKHDGTAVIFWALDRHFGHWPLYVLDWDIRQIEGAFLDEWLPSVFEVLEDYARQCRARFGSLGVWIEDKGSGTILLQQSLARDWQAHPIDIKLTSLGKDERAINVAGYVHAGMIKLTEPAYNKTSIYKGASRNHLLSQVFGFRIGRDNVKDDVLDCFTYGIAIAIGETDLETRG